MYCAEEQWIAYPVQYISFILMQYVAHLKVKKYVQKFSRFFIKSSLIFLLDLYVESVFILQFWCQFGDEKLPPIVFCLKSKVTKIQSERNDLKVVGNKNLVL